MDILLQSLARPRLLIMDVTVYLLLHSVLVLIASMMIRSRYKLLIENSEYYIRIWVPGAFTLTFLFCYNLIAEVKHWFIFNIAFIFALWLLALLLSFYSVYKQLEKK